MTLRHLLLGGRLPAWLGFDRGPIALPGSRGTPRQGQVYRDGGRETSFAPSYRLITDFGEERRAHRARGGPVGPAPLTLVRVGAEGLDRGQPEDTAAVRAPLSAVSALEARRLGVQVR